MWFLRIAEELSNVVPANRRGAICESQRSYLMWFLRIAGEPSNVAPLRSQRRVPANRRGAAI